MIRTVLFDLDGTLIDSTDAIVASFFHMFDTLGAPRPPRETIIASIGKPLHEQLPELTDLDVETCITAYRGHYEATACDSTVLLPGAAEILPWLHDRGIRIGFATSKKREASEMLLDHLGVLQYFGARIGPFEVSRPKPDPEALFAAMAQLDALPEETAFIGDMHFDVLAGKAAGVLTLAVATGYLSRSELERLEPCHLFDSLHEIREFLDDRLAVP